MQVVWFKRDLRAFDHAPLAEAAARGPVLPLYIVEPDLWAQPDMAGRHWAFIAESLEELRRQLAWRGQALVIRVGDAVQVLSSLHADHRIEALWSHQETGNGWTYARDRRVVAWCRARSIPWHEPLQFGVFRRLASRQGWAGRWDRLMAKPLVDTPEALRPIAGLDPGIIPTAAEIGLAPDPCPQRQSGGRSVALDVLDSFLDRRGRDYSRAMSSPNTATDGCSRLSAHLAYGTVSMREVWQATRARAQGLNDIDPAEAAPWRRSLKSFEGRLHWHCHFMQKLEREPAIEFRNLHKGYDGLRGDDPARLQAYMRGETGFPFVDACLRSLTATGWINFRMRAMLMAFASYHLWLDWRQPSLHLARVFTDYEPGIHYPQAQMQSGTTGINTVRLYNPVKQSQDQDPDGAFIRHWCPELSRVPDRFIHEPWKLDLAGQEAVGLRLGLDYPDRIVDHVAAARAARDRVWAVRRGEGYRAAADGIQERHGSRKSGLPPSNPTKLRRRKADLDQASLDL